MCRFDAQGRCRKSDDECKFVHKWFLPLAARSNDRKLAMLAIRNWESHNLEDYFNEKEFVTLVKWANSSSTAPNALNESVKLNTTQPDPARPTRPTPGRRDRRVKPRTRTTQTAQRKEDATSSNAEIKESANSATLAKQECSNGFLPSNWGW